MLARRKRGRWPTLAASFGVLALAISMAWLALVWVRDGAAVANPQASVLAFLLAAAVAVAALVGWVRRRRVAAVASATAEQVRQAAATLAEVVAGQWAQEATARLLGDPEPMPVRWRLSAAASGTPVMDHPEVIAASGLTFAGSSERIAEVATAFRRLDRRRLVITGGPGTGKTTLAVQLLLELLDHPQTDEPVPVLFSLVGWDSQEQPRLQDWLIDRLERDYPALRGFGGETARALVKRGKILPILDGLDEVPIDLRAGIITALNRAALPGGLILTSRRDEYAAAVADAKDVLTAAAVIAPLGLTRLDAVSYLRKLLPPDPGAAWSTVLSQLETGTVTDLAAVTASPLGLWLIRTVYLDGHQDPIPLIENTHPDRSTHPTLQAHLLDQLIPAVVRSRPPTPRHHRPDPHAPLRPRRQHDPDDVRTWLTTLAGELRAAGTRDWLWWHLARHTFSTIRTALTVRLAVGLASGLTFLAVLLMVVLAYGRVDRPADGLADGLVFVLAGGLGVALGGGLAFGLTAAPQHADLRLQGRVSELLRSMALGLTGGLTVGLATVLVIVLVEGLANVLVGGLAFGLAVGLACGLAYGLINFAASPSIAQRASSPADSQRGDRRLTILVISTVGLTVGLAVGLAVGLGFGLALGWGFGLAFGLVAGLVFGPMGRAWPVFLVASGWLVVRRRFPLRLMAFLEDAYRLGLLRVVGSAYQFRHAQLQDHLAHHYQARSGQWRATSEADRARSLTNLAIEHAERGQCEDALVASNEAVTVYRRLAVASPDTFTTDLAASLTNLGTRLANLGQWEQAYAAIEEAVRTCRRLATANPAAFEPQLARTLWASAWAQAAGRLNTAGALTNVEESVAIYQRLAEQSPDAFADDLLAVRRTMAVILDELGRTAEASQIRRQLDGESDSGAGSPTTA